jgi:carbonic anhydrase
MPNRPTSRISPRVAAAGAARPAGRPLPRSSAEAVRRLVAGNRTFVRMAEAGARGEATTMQLDPGELGIGAEPGVAPPQRPFAAILGCADARVPVEMVFQQRSNDVFVVRVAGNGIGLGGLGSFRYASAHFGESLRLVVVLGHSHCGAVTEAVDGFLTPRNYLPLASDYPLRSLVDGILVAVRAASIALERVHGARVVERPGHRAALIEASVVINSAFAAFSLERELGTRRCRVVFGHYDLGSGRLCLPSSDGSSGAATALVAAPRDQDAFRRLGEQVAASAQIEALLRGPAKKAARR